MKTNTQASVECPGCNAIVRWSNDFPHRPFCSQRCKDADFIDWAHEDRRITSGAEHDDIFSDNLGSD